MTTDHEARLVELRGELDRMGTFRDVCDMHAVIFGEVFAARFLEQFPVCHFPWEYPKLLMETEESRELILFFAGKRPDIAVGKLLDKLYVEGIEWEKWSELQKDIQAVEGRIARQTGEV